MNGHPSRPATPRTWPAWGLVVLLCVGSGCGRPSVTSSGNVEPASDVAADASVSARTAGHLVGSEGEGVGRWARRRTPRGLGEVSGDEAAPDQGAEAITDRAAAFAESDPRGGLAWAGRLVEPGQREAALEALAWACATTDRAVSMEALEGLPSGGVRTRLAAHVVGEWAMADPDAALAWSETRPDILERAEALAALAAALAEAQPRRAATIVADRLPAGAVQDRAAMAVIQRWMQADRAAAEQWVAGFPDFPLKEAALAAIHGDIPPEAPSLPDGP